MTDGGEGVGPAGSRSVHTKHQIANDFQKKFHSGGEGAPCTLVGSAVVTSRNREDENC